MARPRVLDTNVLINHWRRFPPNQSRTTREFRVHAEELIQFWGTNLIVYPVLIEFLAGARTSQELELFKAYLEPFEILDKGEIPRRDWEEAKRIAQWVRRDRERKLGDCLIEAIVNRFNGDIVSGDPDFRLRVPPQQ
jgi:predicted nucleic acid-binding protein